MVSTLSCVEESALDQLIGSLEIWLGAAHRVECSRVREKSSARRVRPPIGADCSD